MEITIEKWGLYYIQGLYNYVLFTISDIFGEWKDSVALWVVSNLF